MRGLGPIKKVREARGAENGYGGVQNDENAQRCERRKRLQRWHVKQKDEAKQSRTDDELKCAQHNTVGNKVHRSGQPVDAQLIFCLHLAVVHHVDGQRDWYQDEDHANKQCTGQRANVEALRLERLLEWMRPDLDVVAG